MLMDALRMRILSIFNIHTRGGGRMFFKETYSGVYLKGLNFWIHSTGFTGREENVF